MMEVTNPQVYIYTHMLSFSTIYDLIFCFKNISSEPHVLYVSCMFESHIWTFVIMRKWKDE